VFLCYVFFCVIFFLYYFSCVFFFSVLQVNAEISSFRKRAPLAHSTAEPGNPLQWWMEREAQFPILSKLARQVLAIPATSAASERVFSQAGQIARAARNRLDVGNASQLVFLKGSMKKVESLWGTRGAVPRAPPPVVQGQVAKRRLTIQV
jgi:hAT family C-terminal dimerisation region